MSHSRGGGENLENLAIAIACRHCNGEKDRRHDVNKVNKQCALKVVEKLQKKRMKQWRKACR